VGALAIGGVAERTLLLAGSTVNLRTNLAVGGDVFAAGEDVVIAGTIRGDVRVLARQATVSGAIDGTITLDAQDIVVMPGTRVGGDIVYESPRELFLDRSVQIGGKLVRRTAPASDTGRLQRAVEAVSLAAYHGFAAFLAGLPMCILLPSLVGRASRAARHAFGRSLLLGFAMFLLLPVSAGIAFITIVGIPLALLLAALFGALLYLGKIPIALALGAAVLRRHGAVTRGTAVGCLAVGLTLVVVAGELPVIGSSLSLLIGIVGLGALWWAVLRGELRGPDPQPRGDHA